LNGKTASDHANQTIQEIIKAEKVEAWKTSKELDAAGNRIKDEDLKEAFKEIKHQNEYLNQIFDSAKMQRYALRSTKRNMDFEGLESYGELTVQDIKTIEDALGNIKTSLDRVSFTERQKLDKLLGKNKQYKEMVEYNKRWLESLDKLYVSVANTETLEGHIDSVVDANLSSSRILKSLRGVDQSAEEKGAGKAELDKFLTSYTFGQVVDKRNTAVGKEYSDSDLVQLKTVYDDLLTKIGKEASNWDKEDSKHTIVNDYLAKMLEIVKEGYVRGALGKGDKAKERFQTLNRVVTSQALDKVKEKINVSDDGNLLRDVGLSIIPGYSLVAAILNAKRAFTKDDYEPTSEDPAKAYAEALQRGSRIKYGFMTRDFFAGTTYNARVRFYSGVISTAVQIGAGILAWQLAKGNGGSSSGSGGASSVEVIGGETGGPGTGPK
jgi:hypothetical protein